MEKLCKELKKDEKIQSFYFFIAMSLVCLGLVFGVTLIIVYFVGWGFFTYYIFMPIFPRTHTPSDQLVGDIVGSIGFGFVFGVFAAFLCFLVIYLGIICISIAIGILFLIIKFLIYVIKNSFYFVYKVFKIITTTTTTTTTNEEIMDKENSCIKDVNPINT